MPGLDRSGPMGNGPMTGGARGLCNRRQPGYIPSPGAGFGYGRAMGMGRGRRCGFGARWMRGGREFGGGWGGYEQPMHPDQEREMLLADAEAMERSLESIRKRLEALDKPPAE